MIRRQTTISDTEMIAGMRADFKVFYLRNGKPYFDVMWAPNAYEAARTMLGFAKQLRWRIEIVRVEKIFPDA